MYIMLKLTPVFLNKEIKKKDIVLNPEL